MLNCILDKLNKSGDDDDDIDFKKPCEFRQRISDTQMKVSRKTSCAGWQ